MHQYARFDGIPGDYNRKGQKWFSLDEWHFVYKTIANRTIVRGVVMSLRGQTSVFYVYAAQGRKITVAEIELTGGENDARYMLIHMQDVFISSVTGLPQGLRVEVYFDKMKTTYTPVASQPHPTELLRLRGMSSMA